MPPPKRQPPPSESFDYIFEYLLQRPLYLCGCEVFSPAFRFSIRTVIYNTLVVYSMLSQFYTLTCLDRKKRLICLSLVFIVPQVPCYAVLINHAILKPLLLQGITKMFVYLRQRRFMADQVITLRNLYLQCERPVASTDANNGSPQYRPERQILLAWMKRLNIAIFLFFASILLMVAFSICFPIFAYVTSGEIEFPLPMFLPFVPVDTVAGIASNWVMQLVLLAMAVLGLISTDLSAMMLILHMCIMSDMLCGKVNKMADCMRRRRLTVGAHPNEREDRRFFRECIRLHQAMTNYVSGLSAVYYPVFSVDIMTNFLSNCVMLFVWMNVDYFPLYGYIAMILLKTFLVCALGTMVDVYSDQVLETFETFPFYALPLDEQLKFVVILQRMQMPRVLMAGTFPLNMEMFVKVMKNSYSMAMILMAMTE